MPCEVADRNDDGSRKSENVHTWVYIITFYREAKIMK